MLIYTPALRVLGNMFSGPNELISLALQDPKLLPSLLRKLDDSSIGQKKEVAWVLSNLTAGSPEQVDAVVQAGFVPVFSKLLRSATFDTKKEVAYAFANLCSSQKHFDSIFSAPISETAPILEAFFMLMASPDVDAILLSLQFVEFVLQNKPGLASAAESFSRFDIIEALQYHSNPIVAEIATRLNDKYFNHPGEVDEEADGRN